ncbi:YggT family protein [Dermabacter vaginalis]|uniref:YggT family protein n=1 Tax=Dermabacter vaginalis TaxID=1630135 RepID=A0ABX6A4H3_9MICO|nr:MULTISPECIES: YggT family protein [Dermabacter]MCG7444084.1 YggT family protein [Dermabacter vaginalis]MCT2150499.1 YggT family protein [Dermabacter vaginalis]QEU11456.1 YggT family protein [Dermabacter vaginalis]SHW89183.1 transmembrane protein [Mycobacteroides abscessus subsp. abscessus]
MAILASLVYLAAYVFSILLLVRIGIEMIQSYARSFSPRGLVLIACEAIYTLTDPPVKALRSVIPPLKLGTVALDVSVLIIFFACSLISMLASPYML